MSTLLRAPTWDDLEAIQELLHESNLPIEGLADQFPDSFAVACEGIRIVGSAGLECYGGTGLLRSVAVRPSERARGLGHHLVANRLHAAEEQGLASVYLLTTSAADYFRRLGFHDTSRAEAPACLSKSPEFARICPASATCLVRHMR